MLVKNTYPTHGKNIIIIRMRTSKRISAFNHNQRQSKKSWYTLYKQKENKKKKLIPKKKTNAYNYLFSLQIHLNLEIREI